eukprot:1401353-Lingulodinium_polyedra.AAC.1
MQRRPAKEARRPAGTVPPQRKRRTSGPGAMACWTRRQGPGRPPFQPRDNGCRPARPSGSVA